ncbi:HET-domain-containing protein [Hypoxylon sp. FL1284]|nr:HET-domain-containing protein [Hypoxylon sp. FL1284]
MVGLCLRCRKAGHDTPTCPVLSEDNKLGESNGKLNNISTEQSLGAVSRSSDQLCERCTQLRIIDWLTNEDVRDEVVFGVNGSNLRGLENKRHNADRWLGLGPLRSISLDASCPLCRMIFRVFPSLPVESADEESWAAEYYLRPIRSYNRLDAKLPRGEDGLQTDGDLGKKYAIYAAVNSRQEQTSVLGRYFGDPADQLVYGTDLTFALSHKTPAPSRPGLSARGRDSLYDPDIVKSWMSRCEGEHSASCRVEWSDQLLSCKMIDVSSRQVVHCPQQCRFIALSYVWGGVSPKDGALEGGYLPRTIKDAIIVTRSLGLRYLWVDALCIDQTPSPEKEQQLSMMDVIYSCAWATIVALHGDNSDAGLCGVNARNPRELQGSEWVEGSQLLTIFPTTHQELIGAIYCSRAWTMQEFLLGSRRILFGKHQVHFLCNTSRYCESIDEACDPGGVLRTNPKQPDFFLLPDHKEYVKDAKSRSAFADSTFTGMVKMYTERRMTNDSDSLNAVRGMLSFLQKTMLPQGFAWGLPLKEFPQSLRWYHPRGIKPRRRPDFPSWSYVGWEGTASYTDKLNQINGGPSARFDEAVDLPVSYVGVDDKVLTMEGVLARLEVRNEPFNNAYVAGTDFLLGVLQEGNFLHKNTLSSGVFDFLVVERLMFRYSPEGSVRHVLYMILLEGNGELFTRRSMVRLFIEPGLEAYEEYVKVFTNRRAIHLV